MQCSVDGKIIEFDKTINRRCSKCGARAYEGKTEQGEIIFVHKSCNGYADHKKHCPKRDPDIK